MGAWLRAEEAAAAQPGSGGGVPHTHGETELRFNGGGSEEAEGGSHTRTVKPNSGWLPRLNNPQDCEVSSFLVRFPFIWRF